MEDLRRNFSTAKSFTQLSKTRVLPKVFTEKGLYVLATILKSIQATRASVQIIKTFAKIREFSKIAQGLGLSLERLEF